MPDINIIRLNHTYLKVTFKEAGYAWDCSDFFQFSVNGAKFSPMYQNGVWDGNKRLFNVTTGEIYVGLLPFLMKFAQLNKLTYSREPNILTIPNPVEHTQTIKFIRSLNLPFSPYDYQALALHKVINHRRKLIISPTSSGKSLILYMICRYWEKLIASDKKILILVPTTSLVSQMYGDFADYSTENGWNVAEKCHKIFDGANKHTNKKIVISTWQSVYRMRKKYFEQFDAIAGDEAHNYQAKCIGSIVDKMTHCAYRVGTTGTIGDGECNRLTLSGIFGPIHKTISTKELMRRGLIAQLTVKCVQLKYNDPVFDLSQKYDYNVEKSYLINNKRRNQFITKIAVAQKKNTLILFENKVQGKAIRDMVAEQIKDDPSRKIYFFDGEVGVKHREAARPEIEKRDGCIIIASLGVFSTGVSIKNIHSIVFAWIGKSSIRVLQSIGRGLRISKTKTAVTVYDIFDNMKKYLNKDNYSLKHFKERAKIYKAEEFDMNTQIVNF